MKKKGVKIEGKNKKGAVVKYQKTFLNDDQDRGNYERHEVHVNDTPEHYAIAERVYKLIKDGFMTNEIFATLCVEDEQMTEAKFMKIVADAYKFFENSLLKDREYAFQTHMSRYEDIYQKCMSMEGFWHGMELDKKNPKDIQQIMTKYMHAIKALQYKEELLGLHDKKVVLEFNDSQATIVRNEREIYNGIPGYNLDNLSLEEKVEMLNLIKEARTVPINGIQRVIIKQRKVEIDLESGNRKIVEQIKKIDDTKTIDIKYEEMPPNVVSKFDNQDPQPEIIKDDPTFINNVPEGLERKSLKDVQDKVKEKMMSKLKEKLKKHRQ